jgi:hypothetical protein
MEKITFPRGSDIYLMVIKYIFHIISIICYGCLIKDILIKNYGKNHSSESFRYLIYGSQRHISYNNENFAKDSDKRHFDL